MEPEELKEQSAFITYKVLTQSQKELRDEVLAKVDGTNRRVDTVDDKVDHLRDLVLPLLETSKQTQENTRRMADSLDRFAEGQRATNGVVRDKLSAHDVQFAEINVTSGAQVEVKKANATVIVAIIGGVTTLIASLFALAPYLFG